MRVAVTSDFVCPWCFIGARKLALAVGRLPAGVEIEVAYRPFELNPDMPAEGIARRDYRIGKFGSWERSQALDRQVVEAGAEVGLVFDYDRQERTPSTMLAHRLMWAAAGAGADGRGFGWSLFGAYFSEGRDISDPLVLRGLGVAAGVSEAVIDSVLEGDAGAGEVRGLIEDAYRRGVGGVPLFEIGGKGVSGAQPVDLLESFLRWGASLDEAA